MRKKFANDKYVWKEDNFVDTSKFETERKVRKKTKLKTPKRLRLDKMTDEEAKLFWEQSPVLSRHEEAILNLWYGWREPVGEWEEELKKEIDKAKKRKAPLEFYGEVF